MNKGNERLLAILAWIRNKPRWVLIAITVGIIVVLGVAMFLLIPQNQPIDENSTYLKSTGLAFNVFLKLGVIVLLLIGLAIVLKRWQTKDQVANTKQISVLETVHLSPHRTLYLVNVDGHKLLIGGTDQSLSNLYQIDDCESVSFDSTNETFAQVFDKSRNNPDQFEKFQP